MNVTTEQTTRVTVTSIDIPFLGMVKVLIQFWLATVAAALAVIGAPLLLLALIGVGVGIGDYLLSATRWAAGLVR